MLRPIFRNIFIISRRYAPVRTKLHDNNTLALCIIDYQRARISYACSYVLWATGRPIVNDQNAIAYLFDGDHNFFWIKTSIASASYIQTRGITNILIEEKELFTDF